MAGVSPEGNPADTITLPIPDWPTDRVQSVRVKTTNSFDGDNQVWAGNDYLTRKKIELREVSFILNYAQKEALFTFLASYTGKRVTITGFIEGTQTFVIVSPMIEIQELSPSLILETVTCNAVVSGNTVIPVQTSIVTPFLEGMALRLPGREYSLKELGGTDLVVNPALLANVAVNTIGYILHRCTFYSMKLKLANPTTA